MDILSLEQFVSPHRYQFLNMYLNRQGIFLPYVSCYDRSIEKWVYPFGKLPMGMDHLSIAVVPKGACNPQDPSRVLVFNFRTKNYSTHTSAEILAFDLPKDGWTRDFLNSTAADTEGRWYTFANHTFDGAHDEVYAPRDASGVVMACLLYTSPSPRDLARSRMPSSA